MDKYHPLDAAARAAGGRRYREMSEKQEHRKRLNARIAYASAIERWAQRCPAVIRFFAIRRWLKEMPKKEDFWE